MDLTWIRQGPLDASQPFEFIERVAWVSHDFPLKQGIFWYTIIYIYITVYISYIIFCDKPIWTSESWMAHDQEGPGWTSHFWSRWPIVSPYQYDMLTLLYTYYSLIYRVHSRHTQW